MIVKLNILERLALANIIQRGNVKFENLQTGYEVSELVKEFFLTEDEKAAIEFNLEGEQESFSETKAKELEKDFTINLTTAKKIVESIETAFAGSWTPSMATFVKPVLDKLK